MKLGLEVKNASEHLLPLTVDGYLAEHEYSREELKEVISRYGITWYGEIERVQLEMLLVIGMVIGEKCAQKA